METKISKVSYWIVLLTAVFSTMPIVTITLGGNRITLYNIFLLFFILVLIKYSGKLKITVTILNKYFYIFYILCGVSALYGIVALTSIENSLSTVIGGFVRLSIFVGILTLIGNSTNKENICETYIKGLFIGFVVNDVVAVIDGSGYYLSGNSIVNNLFHSYAATLTNRYEMISIIRNGSIRVSGLNFDPASLGFVSSIVVLYSLYTKKYLLTILGVGAIFFGQSLTGIFATICCIVIDMMIKNRRKEKNRHNNGLVPLFFGVIFLVATIVILTNPNIMDKVDLIIGSGKANIVRRITGVGTEQRIRMGYNSTVLKVAFDRPLNTLIGTGFGTSSVPYQLNPETVGFTTLSTLYDVENTYIALLFDCGILGLIMYLVCYFKAIMSHRDKKGISSIILYYGLLSSVFCMFTYHYILSSNLMMLLIIAFSYQSEKEADLSYE